MSLTQYMIGTSVIGMVNVDTIVGMHLPRGSFRLYPMVYVGADGRTVGDGRPTASWRFDVLTQSELNALRAYLASGSTYLMSAPVYIKTRLDDGTFSTFSAIMHWPEDVESKRIPASAGGVYQDVEIVFTALQQVT